jgi:eukaryotic-like serine/threonine-protein kinase
MKTTGEVYLIFKLYPGEGLDDTLIEFCADHSLPKEVFFEWALQMCKILQYLHEKNYIMHTDVSVRNWFLKEDGDLCLGDWGCAKVLGPFGYTPVGTKIYYDENLSP